MKERIAPPNRKRPQRGSFVMGLIVGLLIGLGLALGVALYVTKVPVPFVNKVPQRTAGQDAAEAERNRNWDPNSPLYGKNPARPGASSASGVVTPDATPAAPAVAVAPATVPLAVPLPPRASAPMSGRDPAAILGDASPATASAAAASAPKPARPAIGGLGGSGADPFTYFVQAGAYGSSEDAEQQRAKLAMMGLTARMSEREQSGRTVYRVRLGPFEKKEEADAAKNRLDGAGVDAALVRVQR